MLRGAGLMAAAMAARNVAAAAFDSAPETVNDGSMPKPPDDRTAGAIRPGRGSALAGEGRS